MQIIRGTNQLHQFLSGNNALGCLADTGLLYAASDTDDRLYDQALDVFEILEEFNTPIYSNVISRMEFVDLIFRKQITIGAIETFKRLNAATTHKALFNLLKSIRDEDTALRSKQQSYKVPEAKLKKLREQLEFSAGQETWKEFCQNFAGRMLFNEWEMLEEDLGLHFVEVLDGQTSDIIEHPLRWSDMIRIMGSQGIRGPDAMIVNLFLKSRLSLLITTDNDIVRSFDESDYVYNSKTIFHLERPF